MPDDNHQDPQRALRERIVNLMRANQQARRKPVNDEEWQNLQTAASRLEQMLKSSADADRQALSGAATRLDELLKSIQSGKEVAVKRRPAWKDQERKGE
jgi:ElaB/YqjD/DUF883 family membrane-anchored ribosome-binding protein